MSKETRAGNLEDGYGADELGQIATTSRSSKSIAPVLE